jgi:hypothetical protein
MAIGVGNHNRYSDAALCRNWVLGFPSPRRCADDCSVVRLAALSELVPVIHDQAALCSAWMAKPMGDAERLESGMRCEPAACPPSERVVR